MTPELPSRFASGPMENDGRRGAASHEAHVPAIWRMIMRLASSMREVSMELR